MVNRPRATPERDRLHRAAVRPVLGAAVVGELAQPQPPAEQVAGGAEPRASVGVADQVVAQRVEAARGVEAIEAGGAGADGVERHDRVLDADHVAAALVEAAAGVPRAREVAGDGVGVELGGRIPAGCPDPAAVAAGAVVGDRRVPIPIPPLPRCARRRSDGCMDAAAGGGGAVPGDGRPRDEIRPGAAEGDPASVRPGLIVGDGRVVDTQPGAEDGAPGAAGAVVDGPDAVDLQGTSGAAAHVHRASVAGGRCSP